MKITLPADVDRLEALRDDIEHFCLTERISRNDCQRISVVIDELASNTIKYGNCRDQDRILVELTHDTGRLIVSYRDSGRPFDPLSIAPACGPPVDDPRGAVGRYGWPLIRSFSTDISYRYENGCNVLNLTIPLRT